MRIKEKGITLVALVITIIILLILAGIAISTLTNEGILTKSSQAKNEYQNAQIAEEKYLEDLENQIDKQTSKKAEVGTTIAGITIASKEYTFTCIDTNYQGYNLYLCDEVIPYSVCGPNNSKTYANSTLRTWLNNNAPENAKEITLEDTGTTEKMFILSKDENEKYEPYTSKTWEGSNNTGNGHYWTRTYAGNAGWMYVRKYSGEIGPLDVHWTAWAGCKPVFASEE